MFEFNSFNSQFEKAYAKLNKNMIGHLFPGGKQQAKLAMSSLKRIFRRDIKCGDLLNVYINIFTRMCMSMAPHMIKISLLIKFPELFSNDIAYKAIGYVTLNMQNNTFGLSENEDMSLVNSIADDYEKTESIIKSNSDKVDSGVNFDDYGFAPTNPIYVGWLNGSREYLNKLKPLAGGNCTWKRICSTSEDCINGMIDVYEISSVNGNTCKLYINMYADKTSTSAPKGFILENSGTHIDDFSVDDIQ